MKKSLKQKSKRQVFKHILESPFSYQWYARIILDYLSSTDRQRLDKSYSTGVLESLLRLLEPVKQYRLATNKLRQHKRDVKRQRTVAETKVSTKEHDDDTSPAILPRLYFGINSCTKLLEHRIKARQAANESTDTTVSIAFDPIAVFVCVDDCMAAHMISHLPVLAHQDGDIFICPLPRGSELQLGNGCAMKRVCCMAVEMMAEIHGSIESDDLKDLTMAVKSHWEPVKLSWFCLPPAVSLTNLRSNLNPEGNE